MGFRPDQTQLHIPGDHVDGFHVFPDGRVVFGNPDGGPIGVEVDPDGNFTFSNNIELRFGDFGRIYQSLGHLEVTDGHAIWIEADEVQINTDELMLSGHDAYAWPAVTPGRTNLTVGNGTEVCRAHRVGPNAQFSYELTFGTTTAFTGTVQLTVPTAVPWDARPARRVRGALWAVEAGVRNYTGTALLGTNGVIDLVHSEAGNGGTINATNPFTWAGPPNADAFGFDFPPYQLANP